MSKKKKLKPRKKKSPPAVMEFEFDFSDITLVETDGEYDRVRVLLEDEVGKHDWVVKSNLTISSQFGQAAVLLDFYHDRNIYIIDYTPSTSNIYYNPDLSALIRWSQMYGWKIPQPVPSLVRLNIPFWKHMWEALMVDSDYLDKRFGERNLDIRVRQTELDKEDGEEDGEE